MLYERSVGTPSSDDQIKMATELQTHRRSYADELRFVANVRSSAVVEAFATVPRERFVGPGPWRIRSPMNRVQYWTTEDADPRHVYHDVLIALNEARALNNGQPSLWAALFDVLNVAAGEQALHLGCGTGYYSAILAELVGGTGKVRALEIDRSLAAQASVALEPWPQAEVIATDGAGYNAGQVDLIVASAGATHPAPTWLEALKPGARLLLPLTAHDRGGAMLLVTRQEANAFAARFLRPVGFIEFAGLRDPEMAGRLDRAFRNGDMDSVRSLRRAPHPEDETCWLHGQGWCLSTKSE